jgi:surface antigen
MRNRGVWWNFVPSHRRSPFTVSEQSFAPFHAIKCRIGVETLAAWGSPAVRHRWDWGLVMHIARLGAAAIIAASVAACAATPETGQGAKENTGTLVGALAGGLIGSQFGGGTGERIAAGLAGAAIGGMIGNRIGASMDDEDRQRAYAAQMQALESGKSGAAVAWRNPDSGRYGSVVPGPAYQSNGLQCRPFTHTIYIDGRPQVARGNACRNPDGTWTAVG